MTQPNDQPQPSAHPAPAKGLWNGLKAHILHPELSPEQVAWSFALGLSIAWNPLLGLHTAMVFLFCVIFRRLHRPLMIMAMLVNNPWTTVPIATATTWVGNLVRGHFTHGNLARVQWHEIGWRSFLTWSGFEAMTTMLRPILKSYLIGGVICTVLALPVGYFFMLWLAKRLRRIHWPHLHHHTLPQDIPPGG
ncbi:hypothetical protein GETHLI_10750 [Geothrix limicola]|uniref:DUF2062 domain-containing protein n=1 Tax=Geothrix limicola TaxID=2927978 RepID=A0ABQ5QDD1_9BACT|nr:DUF2062 domain-containing protein [Geothrix limicola]GLH72573.1 hypothetical protein GETHLI_10750 [Geothrix limicola]